MKKKTFRKVLLSVCGLLVCGTFLAPKEFTRDNLKDWLEMNIKIQRSRKGGKKMKKLW